jgi:hypothetical protein
MFGGKILVSTRKQVPNSLKMHSYQDVWQDSVDIDFDGELTPEVCRAICDAYKSSGRLGSDQSGYGALRWSNADRIVGVNTDNRQLILECSVNLAD